MSKNYIAELDDRLKLIQNDIEKKDYCRTLYHYRGASSAIKMIKNNELRFASHDYLKHEHDEAETDGGFNAIVEAISEYACSCCDDCKQFFHEYFRNLFLKLKNCLSIYTLSFCKENNNKNLWKKYAGKGNGIVLGFEFKSSNEPTSNIWETYYGSAVFYDKEKFKECIRRFIKPCNDFLHDKTRLIDRNEIAVTL